MKVGDKVIVFDTYPGVIKKELGTHPADKDLLQVSWRKEHSTYLAYVDRQFVTLKDTK